MSPQLYLCCLMLLVPAVSVGCAGSLEVPDKETKCRTICEMAWQWESSKELAEAATKTRKKLADVDRKSSEDLKLRGAISSIMEEDMNAMHQKVEDDVLKCTALCMEKGRTRFIGCGLAAKDDAELTECMPIR
jgi:hypothetical protein